ncbi:MAG: hypothetical protein ACLQF2_17635 [Rhodomicrobium sp.]
MKVRKSIASAIAVAGFAFLGSAALADPIAQSSASAVNHELTAASQSTFTLIRRGFARAGGARGVRAGGVRGRAFAGRRGFVAGRGAVARRGVVAGRRYAGGRRVWQNGRWWYGPAAVGLGVGVAGGSCYWNCRNAGHGPAFCSTYAANFCS